MPCENFTSDCNDDNPCTIDDCVEDICVHAFDETKSSFGSCEADGLACTVGKCVSVQENIFCHEQRKEFLSGDIGCRDDNQCTADSCVESALELKSSTKKDEEGNVILRSKAQCVYEIMEKTSCFVEDACTPGVCTITGSGMPDDEFALSCVEISESEPQPFCPDTDNNPCTIETCNVGVGCVSTPVEPDTDCNDNDPCTINDACQTDPMSEIVTCFGTPKVKVSTEEMGFDDGNPCTEDMCSEGLGTNMPLSGPFGSTCATNYIGVCSAGVLQCLEGEEISDMCVPMFRPGDKTDSCINTNGLDDDCDGEIDECDCPETPEESIERYVNPNGNNAGPNDCTDINNPCQTIAYAISVANADDTLILSDGTFNENNIVVNTDLFIFGQGPSVTVVDAQGSNRVFTVNSDVSASFCGLGITGGLSPAATNGGGLLINSGANVSITQTFIYENEASNFGGGVYVDSSATVNIELSTIRQNAADSAAGIYNGSAAITNVYETSIIDNTAITWAGIGNFGSIIMDSSSISNNQALSGSGGMFNNGVAAITNSTISGNSANTNDGGILNSDTIEISNSTITKNQGGNNVGGIRNVTGAAANIYHTVIADQTIGQDCLIQGGTFTSNGYNLESGTSCGFTSTGDLQNATADLGPLQDNGGPTFTHSLGDNSDAIDAGDTSCGVSVDQRGFFRPIEYPGIDPIDGQARCDIGAFERQVSE